MYTFLTILIFIVCGLLVLAVLVQNSKGGGLASGFSGGSQVMGVRKTADFLEKATWYLAVGLMVLCIATNFSRPAGKTTEREASAAEKKAKETGTAPAAPQQQQQQAPAGGNNQAPAPAGK